MIQLTGNELYDTIISIGIVAFGITVIIAAQYIKQCKKKS